MLTTLLQTITFTLTFNQACVIYISLFLAIALLMYMGVCMLLHFLRQKQLLSNKNWKPISIHRKRNK